MVNANDPRSGRKPALDAESVGVVPKTVNHGTRLPHVQADGVAQHVCFRLADSLPAKVRRELAGRSSVGNDPGLQANRRGRFDAALDAGYGRCWLREPDIAATVRDALRHFDGQRYLLHEWVIMPNHVHALFTPLRTIPLSSIVHSWKSYTAKRANRLAGLTGSFWHVGCFDRMIRNERHFRVTADYIRANPVNAGPCEAPEDWRWSSAYQPCVRDARPVYLLSPVPRPPRATVRPRQFMRTLHAS